MRSLIWLILFALTVPAQEPQDVVRISTNLVQIDVVVTKDGKQVKDLKAEDFEIREDGRLQPITNFAFISVNSSSTKPAPGTPSNPTITTTPPQPHDVKRTLAIVVDDLVIRSKAWRTCDSTCASSSAKACMRKISSPSFAPVAKSARCNSSQPTRAC